MQKRETSFPVHGITVRGFFHLPDDAGDQQLPLVVMFNGFATEWQFGTAAFIERFTDMGFATLNFDYRSFGGSDGEPRQLLDIPAQLQDCAAAIAHGLVQEWVDPDRLIIWGSSLGGGHALTMASEFKQVAAVIAQVPHCSSRAAFRTVTLGSVITGMKSAIADAVGSKFGAADRYLPVLPPAPGKYGVLGHEGWAQHYLQIADNSPTWQNGIVARSLLRGADYNPLNDADKIRCPALLVAGRHDAGVPVASVEETAGRIPDCELHIYPGDHFAVYHGEPQPEILDWQCGFLQRFSG